MSYPFKRAYTFDDVALVPQYNNVPSRTHPSLETWLTKNRKMESPFIASNMDSVIGEDLADVLIRRGSIPIFHRFTTEERQEAWVRKYKENSFISWGFVKTDKELDKLFKLLDLGAGGVCIDVAHGHSSKMFEFIGKIKKSHPHVDVIAGNVATPMAYHDLANAGADAVKVGIGPGAACTTRMVTGFGVPQFTAIYECGELAKKLRVPLIADGGIRSSRDAVIALAAGASSVMLGKMFALTTESAAEKRKNSDGRMEARYRGQASKEFQNEYYGGLKEKTVAEGAEFWAAVYGSADALLDELTGGLRSGLTYGGAKNIKELQRKAEFVEVSPNYIPESQIRPGK